MIGMSEVIRYLPLPSNELNLTLPGGNFSVAGNGTSVVRQLLGFFGPVATPVGVLALVILSTIVALFLITLWYSKDVAAFARHYAVMVRRALDRAHEEPIEYVYPGFKLTLRKYYLRLREKIGCGRCTPRELALRCGKEEYVDFAQLYEDVVYGSRPPTPEVGKVLARLDGSV